MKKSEIKVGGIYVAKVSGKLTRVRVDEIDHITNLRAGKRVDGVVYRVTNLITKRQINFRSAMKFRQVVAAGVVEKLIQNRPSAVAVSIPVNKIMPRPAFIEYREQLSDEACRRATAAESKLEGNLRPDPTAVRHAPVSARLS